MKAILRNYRQAPRKVRLIADVIRGKNVNDALQDLEFLNKKAAGPFAKLLKSAVANAKQAGKKEEGLIVEKVTVDKGVTFRRYLRHAKRVFPLKKETSHISIILGEK